MSNIDERLREILLLAYNDDPNMNAPVHDKYLSEDIAQIKQVFADERPIVPFMGLRYEAINGKTRRFYLNNQPLMTPQEFYENFEKELTSVHLGFLTKAQRELLKMAAKRAAFGGEG